MLMSFIYTSELDKAKQSIEKSFTISEGLSAIAHPPCGLSLSFKGNNGR